MLTIKRYVRAQSLDEAYTLCQKRANVVLGGMLWLKTQNRTVDTAIDLSGLGLDTIEETPEAFRLGAMVTLRQLEQHHGGAVPLAEYAARPYERDILTHVVIPKQPGAVAYLAQRNISTDFPVLTCAVAVRADGVRCAVGARPMKARLYQGDAALTADTITPETAEAFGERVAAEASFGSNLRAGADYRRAICKVLVRRALLACKEDA